MEPTVARGLAHAWHAHQRDRGGRLITEHVERVASAVPAEARSVAYLHDIFERTAVSHEELRANGLTAEEASALELLTRMPGEEYALYALRIVHAPGTPGRLARAVKIADLEEHLRLDQLARSPGAPPYAWAHRHIAVAQQRRGETPVEAVQHGRG